MRALIYEQRNVYNGPRAVPRIASPVTRKRGGVVSGPTWFSINVKWRSVAG